MHLGPTFVGGIGQGSSLTPPFTPVVFHHQLSTNHPLDLFVGPISSFLYSCPMNMSLRLLVLLQYSSICWLCPLRGKLTRTTQNNGNITIEDTDVKQAASYTLLKGTPWGPRGQADLGPRSRCSGEDFGMSAVVKALSRELMRDREPGQEEMEPSKVWCPCGPQSVASVYWYWSIACHHVSELSWGGSRELSQTSPLSTVIC